MPSRQVNVGSIKSLFDELIDRHAEAYLAAHPELKEFSSFEKSGTINYYIGMIWVNDYERPSTNSIRIRGSQILAKNKLVELDLSSIRTEQAFFPGQIVAFAADPFLKKQLVVRKFLDPISIAPPMKKINTVDKINLIIASGPYMRPEQEDWTLFEKLVENIKIHNATHIILIGPFVDMENKVIKSHYETSWKLIFNKLAEGLHDHECNVYIVPSNRDILPSNLKTDYFYPSSELRFKLDLKEGTKLKCVINSVTDPCQIDLGGLYVDVTAADVLFHAKNCMSTLNRQPGNLLHQLTPAFKHIITHGIYPLYPPPLDTAIDFPKLQRYLTLDRLGAHIVILPNKFTIPPVFDVDNRIVVGVKKCSVTKQLILIEIPIIESNDEAPIDSLIYTNYTHKMIDLIDSQSQNMSITTDYKGDLPDETKSELEDVNKSEQDENKTALQDENKTEFQDAKKIKLQDDTRSDLSNENQMEVV